jgi:hypothetical protein
MRKTIYIYFGMSIFLLLNAIACQNKNKPTSDEGNIRFEKQTTTHKSGTNCDGPDSLISACATISITTLKPAGGNSSIHQAIQDTLKINIQKMVAECISEEDEVMAQMENLSIDTLSKLLFAQHENFISDFPEISSNVWSVEINVDSIYQNPKCLTLGIQGFTYLGGAHPNSYISYFNFDKKTGKTLLLDDIIVDKKAFLALAEKEFRANQELTEEQNLEEAGYFFDKGVYNLPAQYAITEEGLMMFYNTYEAAAYVVGQISFIIPYKSLEGIVSIDKLK